MSRLGSGVTLPAIGARVRHPLWPELGVGELKATSKAFPGNATYATGRVHWSTGQVSTHNLAVLRKVDR